MKKLLLALVATVAVSAQANQQTEKCMKRISDACNLSWTEVLGMALNVEECKQIRSGQEGVLLKNGTVTLVNTRSCNGDQFRFPGAPVEKTKSISGKLY